MLGLDLFWLSSHILSTIAECLIFKFTMDIFSKRKKNNLVALMITGMTVITITLNIIGININVKLAIGIISSIIIYWYNYEDSKLRILIICSIYWLGFLGTDILSVNIILALFRVEDASYLYTSKVLYLLVVITAKLLLVLMIKIFKSAQMQLKVKLTIKPKELLFIAIPIVSNFINIIVLYSFRIGLMDNYKSKDFILASANNLSAISNLALIFIIIKVIKESELRMENRAIKEKIEYQYNHYIQLQDAQLKVRQLYHDMNNHLICIEAMNRQNKESQEYIDKLKLELNNWTAINTTGDMVLDIILSEKRAICLNNNIEFSANINFRNCDFIDMMDVCTIFSNILDNAIEACDKIHDKDKYIKIVGNIINKFYVIRCENSKINVVSKNKNSIFTDKKDKFLHGLGINNIKACIEKYNGNTSIDYTEEKFIISMYIPMKNDSDVIVGEQKNELINSNL